MQTPYIAATCSVLGKEYIFWRQGSSIRYIFQTPDEESYKAPVLLGSELDGGILAYSLHKMWDSAPVPQEEKTDSKNAVQSEFPR